MSTAPVPRPPGPWHPAHRDHTPSTAPAAGRFTVKTGNPFADELRESIARNERWMPETPEERALIGHVRGWCHNGAVCQLCTTQASEYAFMRRAHAAENTLNRIIGG